MTTLLVASSLFAYHATARASADQVSDLKAQAASISEKLIQQQLEIGAYQQQYSVASAAVAADARAIDRIDQQITTDQQLIDRKARTVRHTAIMSYINAGSESPNTSVALFSGSGDRVQAATEYSSIALGNITTALDELHTAQRTLVAQQSALQVQQARDQADRTQQANDLGQATTTARQMQSVQAQVTGQLAAAVAQQTAAQDAAAAAAVAAAQRSAVRTASTASPPSTIPPSTIPTTAGTSNGTAPAAPVGGSLSDPALNPFLQCVVQAESGGNYGAVSPDGQYMGAFQFSQATWNSAAAAAGLSDLVGVPPNVASKAAQDTVAVALYSLDGQQPWLGDRCSS